MSRSRPHAFLLSHFHEDHYDGLYEVRDDSLWIRQVYLPQIPDFPEWRDFTERLFAMNEIMGRQSGYAQRDLLSEIERISVSRPQRRYLSQGDSFHLGGTHFKVVWPPKSIESSSREQLKGAIGTFEQAANEYPILQRIVEEVEESNLVDRYQEPDRSRTRENSIRGQEPDESEPLWPDGLPPLVSEANKKLRNAANILCLAFNQDNRFLFLGDLNAADIGRSVRYLSKRGHTEFSTILTAHHGTQSHPKLADLHAPWVISSAGEGDIQGLEEEWQDLFDRHWITHFSGDFRCKFQMRVRG